MPVIIIVIIIIVVGGVVIAAVVVVIIRSDGVVGMTLFSLCLTAMNAHHCA